MLWLFLIVYISFANILPERAEYVIQFKNPQEDPLMFARARQLQYIGPVAQLTGYHRFSLLPAASKRAEMWIRDPEEKVLWMERQEPRQQHTRFLAPSDPLYTQQWHHVSTKTKAGWDLGYSGQGVRVAIVDDGVQHTHPDLSSHYAASLSHDYNEGDSDPSPGLGNFHGTSCAGVMGASANNTHCGTGVAPAATLIGVRLIAAATTDVQEAIGLSHRTDLIDVYSNSWGPRDDGMNLAGPGRVTLEAFAANAQRGRGGKGNIYVWASGNGRHLGDSCAYDGYASSPYTIAVGAVDYENIQSYYSEGCSALMCVAPSSGDGSSHRITTVDVSTPGQGYSPGSECTSDFGGTSSATPLVAGAIALALEANPSLTWRDVQVLLAKTSTAVDTSDPGWSSNGRGFRHNERYGFGKIDIPALLEHARTWTTLPPQRGFSSGRVRVALTIAGDGTPLRISHAFARSQITFVEHVLLRIYLRHPKRGQLRIRLKSPENVVSTLADVHPDPHADYPGWLFTSVRHFGEKSADGDWYIAIEDLVTDQYSNGIFDSFELAVFGH